MVGYNQARQLEEMLLSGTKLVTLIKCIHIELPLCALMQHKSVTAALKLKLPWCVNSEIQASVIYVKGYEQICCFKDFKRGKEF